MSKNASRKRRRKFRKKHLRYRHVFGSWMFGSVVCNFCHAEQEFMKKEGYCKSRKG